MKTINDINLSDKERLAIEQAAALLKERFSVVQVILFGSKARGDDDAESDIDLLIVTHRDISWQQRKAIIDTIYDVESLFDVVISVLIASISEWEQGTFSVLPIHQEIREHGVFA